jgi:hypothetical protein
MRHAGIDKQFVGGFAVLTKKPQHFVYPDWRKFQMPMTLQRARWRPSVLTTPSP